MAPLQKAASRRSSSTDCIPSEGDSRHVPLPQQAGRTPSGLAASAAAATIHQSDKGSPCPAQGPSLTNTPDSQLSDSANHTRRKAPTPPFTARSRTKPFPTASSLNRRSSTDSTNGRKGSSDGSLSSQPQDALLPPGPGGSELPRLTTAGSGQSSSARVVSRRQNGRLGGLVPGPHGQLGRPRAAIPMNVHELGSDYSRYFNPFSDRYQTSCISPSGIRSTSVPSMSDGTSREGASTTKLPKDPEKEVFIPLDDRLSAPFASKGLDGFPLYLDEKEADDDMHMPNADDDIRYKTTWKDHFTRETIGSTIGCIMMVVGLLILFIVLPVLGSAGIISWGTGYTPLDQMHNQGIESEPWEFVNSRAYPLLRNIRSGLIDPATPARAKTRKSVDGDDLVLVFSDEFNNNNRTFYPGDDPYFFAPDIWYGATQDLEWYDPDAATTRNGVLELRLERFPNHNLQFRSGMLNTWNQLCFKGGVFEVSVSLPGPGGVMGLWPGAWTMGNLGRPGYLATTEGMWPYTYDDCDVGITPNQSMNDGTSNLPGQRLPACTCPGADHPTPGTGRGAPEIDILEASADWNGLPVITQSYQVAPFDIWYYPNYNYTACPNPEVSFTNVYTGGPFQQAVSTTTSLNKRWFDGKAYQKYAYEYTPGTGAKGKISWFVGEEMVYQFDGRAIGPNGNIGSRVISEEPMSMVFNLGLSNSWVFIDWNKLKFPAVMRVDYVRWYQKKNQRMVTCDPPGYETTEYIKNHPRPYNDPNLTRWEQSGYDWPKNSLMHQC